MTLDVKLRAEDEAECRLGGRSPAETLADSIARSTHSEELVHQGETICWWGYCAPSLLGPVAHMWMLSAPGADVHKVFLARYSLGVVRRLLDAYPLLFVQVDPTYTLSVRWLKWLGFEFHQEMGPWHIMLASKNRTYH